MQAIIEEARNAIRELPLRGVVDSENFRRVDFEIDRIITAAIERACEPYRNLVEQIDLTLRVPAAEYVPAIGDVFTLIDSFKQEH